METTISAAVIARVEQQITEETAKYDGSPKYRRWQAFSGLLTSKAQIIADDVMNGERQYPPRVEDYRCLRAMEAAELEKATS